MHPDGVFIPDLVGGERRIGGRTFDFSRQVAVLGIVENGVEAALAAVADGADWVGLGGPPSTPDVSQAEELDRVIPLVAATRAASDVVISVGTYRTEVARQAIAVGANVVHDTSGLSEPELADLVADSDATLVITHPLPRTADGDLVPGVVSFLAGRVEFALSRGVPPERIVVDPGPDLDKNAELTRRLDEVTALGYPTLVAPSGETLDLAGTIAADVFCVLKGARIVRVHDVRAAVRAIRFTEAVFGWRPPAYARHNLTPPPS